MAAFATIAELEVSWRVLSSAEQATAAVKLDEASLMIRALRPGIDALIGAGSLDPGVPRLVVCGMVKRAMNTPSTVEGVGTVQQSAGPFGQTLTYANPDGNLYLSKLEKKMLGIGRQRAFSIDLGGGDVPADA